MQYTYRIFDLKDGLVLPDGKKYYDKITYDNRYYLDYFNTSTDWLEDNDLETYFYSNYEERSVIKTYSNTIAAVVSNKYRLAELLEGFYYNLETFVFRLHEGDLPLKIYNWKPTPGELWFLKKVSNLTYGGYDVFPIRAHRSFNVTVKALKRLIGVSNRIPKYRSNVFLLQRGVDSPMLLRQMGKYYKFDIRAYGLIVQRNRKVRPEYYFFKHFLTRRSIQPYDPTSLSKDTMITNTTHAKENDVDVGKLTSLRSSRDRLYSGILAAYSHLVNNVFERIKNKSVTVCILGLDYIYDTQGNIYLLEVNRRPVIHSDPDKCERLHHNLELKMFDEDFYQISFEAIVRRYYYRQSTDNWDYISKRVIVE